ncbi:MAG: thiolase family protein [Flavobacteriales bacterium]
MKNTAYIVKGYRSAVGKAPKGRLRFTRPDVMAAQVIKHLLNQLGGFDPELIDDVIVGNAMPEAEQGLNMARLISLMGLNTVKVPGVTVNRYCASGSESIALAVAKIQSGMAKCILAGGAESMSYIPMGGYKPVPEFDATNNGHSDYYFGMGLTAEEVANTYGISRKDQDEFALNSHKKALKAQETNRFASEIAPITIEEQYLDEHQQLTSKTSEFAHDEGPRKNTSIEALNGLRPVFAQGGSVTAGNSSQMSDGAAFVMIMDEETLKKHNLKPWAKLVSYATVGLEPKIMGMGPAYAVPKALEQANLKLEDIGLFELNEAFASQSLAVIRALNLNPDLVNVNGGAIALGHPLGCSGTKLTVQLLNEMEKRNVKYGMVTMCVGTGQGAASIFELM